MIEPARIAFPLKQAYPFAEELGLGAEADRIRDLEIHWDLAYDSSVRRGYFIELFRTHGLLDRFIAERWPVGATPWGIRERERLLRLKDRYEAFLTTATDDHEPTPALEEPSADQEFAAEADLRDFLAKHLPLVEPGLQVFAQDGRSGVEFPVEDGRIDILGIDERHQFVVIELKLSRGRNKTLGQLLYYMGWVDAHLGSGPCRGFIIAREITPDLKLAAQRVTGVSLFSYTLSLSVHAVS